MSHAKGKLVTVDHWHTVTRVQLVDTPVSPSSYPKEGIGEVTYYIPSIYFPIKVGETFIPLSEQS
jgi:hypothetical protein